MITEVKQEKGKNYYRARKLNQEHPTWTLQRIGDKLGISRERVRQLLGDGRVKRETRYSVLPSIPWGKRRASNLASIHTVAVLRDKHPEWSVRDITLHAYDKRDLLLHDNDVISYLKIYDNLSDGTKTELHDLFADGCPLPSKWDEFFALKDKIISELS